MHPTFQKILSALDNDKILNRLGLGGIRIVKERTRKGLDVDGKSFKPYSEGYKKKREEAGLVTDIVNLEFDDLEGMLHKVDHEVNNSLHSVQMLIDDPEKETIAGYHNIQGAGKSKVIRKFWGFSEEEKEKLRDIALEGIHESLLKALN